MEVSSAPIPTRILVTGAGGQLGRTLRKCGSEASHGEWIFTTSRELDVCDPKALEAFFEEHSPQVCINCAAYTNVEKAEDDPEEAFRVNAEAVLSLAQCCKKYNTLLIHISTDYVFDGAKGAPYMPDDTPNPINVYGRSKLKGEQYIKETLDRYYIVRTSWLYSREFGHNFYRTIKRKAEEGSPLQVVDDQVGCPTDTANLTQYILKLMDGEPAFGIKHYCDGPAMTWYGFAKRILEENRLKTALKPVDSGAFKQKAKRPAYSVLMVS